MLRFVRLLIARRRLRDMSHERSRLSLNRFLHGATKVWHGVNLGQPDWSPSSHSLAFDALVPGGELRVHIIWNAYWEPLDFELPLLDHPAQTWRRWIDTTLESPHDIVDWQQATPITGRSYRAGPRSVVVLIEV